MKACIWCDALVEFGQGPSVRPAWKRWKYKGCGVFGYINLFSVTALIGILNNAGFKNIKRIYRPVAYRNTGIKAMALSVT